ncbi:MAG: crossover junction endodeoxyribonuclease RuvC, partial [Candidatus Gastranaerophilales bacterium]|nr:crossover junction endodeoxyribonuclease RuvC [Candidatus Gastranaerophilales bacterium]
MRIFGIDPGVAIVGYSVIDIECINGCNSYALIDSGSIQTSKNLSTPDRLLEIAEDMDILTKKFKPDIASIEKLFYFKNAKTIMPVAEARGVILMILRRAGIEICEYTPLEVKQT